MGAKVTKDHPGGFKVLSGWANTADGQLTGGKVEIDLSSVFTDSEKLTKHLMDPDFFDVGVYPTATFEISGVEAGGAGGAGGSSTVVGTLDLHGVRKELRFPATVTVTDGRASVAAEFTLMRKDFGITYPGKAEDLIRDEVLVKGELVFGG